MEDLVEDERACASYRFGSDIAKKDDKINVGDYIGLAEINCINDHSMSIVLGWHEHTQSMTHNEPLFNKYKLLSNDELCKLLIGEEEIKPQSNFSKKFPVVNQNILVDFGPTVI